MRRWSLKLCHYRFGIPVCPHAGGVGLCQYTIHLRHEIPAQFWLFLSILCFSLIDYIAISGSIERNVLECVPCFWISAVAYGPLFTGWRLCLEFLQRLMTLQFADHLHENFVYPVSLNHQGCYNVPDHPDEGYRWHATWRFTNEVSNIRSTVSNYIRKASRLTSGQTGSIGRLCKM